MEPAGLLRTATPIPRAFACVPEGYAQLIRRDDWEEVQSTRYGFKYKAQMPSQGNQTPQSKTA